MEELLLDKACVDVVEVEKEKSEAGGKWARWPVKPVVNKVSREMGEGGDSSLQPGQ